MKFPLARNKITARRVGRAAVLILVGLLSYSLLQVLSLRWFNPRVTAFMLAEKIGPGTYHVPWFVSWLPAELISPNLARAVLAAEDQRFFEHRGFDWVEIERAVKDHDEGERLRGASTISMQLARNLFLWSGRSWVRKGLEAYYTVLLELILGKVRILEIYLNVAEFGPGIFGVKAACEKYFKSPDCRLTRDQAASLAMILPAPKRWSPFRTKGCLTSKKQHILRQMDNIILPDWPQAKPKNKK
ncbi:MAG: monofunctional biosynthetic peptidoglycan transglycosylase [Pseudomonadota bacterium]